MRSCDASGHQLVPVFTWKKVGVETEAFAEDDAAVRALFAPGGAGNSKPHKRIQKLLQELGVGARDDDGVLMMTCLGVQYVLSDHAVVKALGEAGRVALEEAAKEAGSSDARATGPWEQRLQDLFDECLTPGERAQGARKVVADCLEGCSPTEKEEIITRLRRQSRGPTGRAPPALGEDATRQQEEKLMGLLKDLEVRHLTLSLMLVSSLTSSESPSASVVVGVNTLVNALV